MEPGDLMIFNTLLAHGVRPNHSDDRVRMAQYISMFPADEDDAHERAERIRHVARTSNIRAATPSPAIRATGRRSTPGPPS